LPSWQESNNLDARRLLNRIQQPVRCLINNKFNK
jgi:hypothetical protein